MAGEDTLADNGVESERKPPCLSGIKTSVKTSKREYNQKADIFFKHTFIRLQIGYIIL